MHRLNPPHQTAQPGGEKDPKSTKSPATRDAPRQTALVQRRLNLHGTPFLTYGFQRQASRLVGASSLTAGTPNFNLVAPNRPIAHYSDWSQKSPVASEKQLQSQRAPGYRSGITEVTFGGLAYALVARIRCSRCAHLAQDQTSAMASFVSPWHRLHCKPGSDL